MGGGLFSHAGAEMWRPTQRLHAVLLLAARLAAGLTADVVKGEEDVVFLVHVDRQLKFNLDTVRWHRNIQAFKKEEKSSFQGQCGAMLLLPSRGQPLIAPDVFYKNHRRRCIFIAILIENRVN